MRVPYLLGKFRGRREARKREDQQDKGVNSWHVIPLTRITSVMSVGKEPGRKLTNESGHSGGDTG